jgi:hypothetical protein
MLGLIDRAAGVVLRRQKMQQMEQAVYCCRLDWHKDYSALPRMAVLDTTLGMAIVPKEIEQNFKAIKEGRLKVADGSTVRENISEEIERGIRRLHRWSREYFFDELAPKQIFFLLTGQE